MTPLTERVNQKPEERNGSALMYSVKNIDMDMEWITPEKARAYRDTMGPNRSVSPAVVEKYGQDMSAERWMVNTQAIGFDIHGQLIDGQHRLEAVIKTGKAVYMPVFRNLHPDAMRTVDDNRKRTFSDDLKIEGRERYVKVAAATLMIVRFERGRAKGLKLSTATKMPLSRIAARQDLALIDSVTDANLAASVRIAAKLRNELKVPESAGAAAHYLGTRHYGEEFVETVFHALISGEDLHEGDPTLALRQRFIKSKDIKPKTIAHIQAAAILKAMRMEAKGQSLTMFKMHDLPGAVVSDLYAD